MVTAVTDPASNHNEPHVLGDTSQLVAILLPALAGGWRVLHRPVGA